MRHLRVVWLQNMGGVTTEGMGAAALKESVHQLPPQMWQYWVLILGPKS